MKKTSQKGIDLIKSFERCVLYAYKPIKEEIYYTIGYGHYGSDVFAGMKITQSQAEAFLKKDLAKFEEAVNTLAQVPLNQNQFDALVSFTYNCGIGALKSSTLLKLLNKKDYAGTANQFLVWIKDERKKDSQGLIKRRNLEKSLFLLPYTTNYYNLPYEVETTADLNIREDAGTAYKIKTCVKKGTILKVWAIKTVGTVKWGKNEKGYFNLAYTKTV